MDIHNKRKAPQIIGIGRITELDSSVNSLSALLEPFWIESLPIRVLISTVADVISPEKLARLSRPKSADFFGWGAGFGSLNSAVVCLE